MSEREFVVINEEAARTAQNMMSFNEYQPGSRTKEYQEDVNEVYDLAEEVVARRGEEYRERAWRLATRYAKNLGKYFNEEARIGCMCPSVMISGAGNFPVKKKEKQVKAWDKNHEFYNYCQSIRGKLNAGKGIHIFCPVFLPWEIRHSFICIHNITYLFVFLQSKYCRMMVWDKNPLFLWIDGSVFSSLVMIVSVDTGVKRTGQYFPYRSRGPERT